MNKHESILRLIGPKLLSNTSIYGIAVVNKTAVNIKHPSDQAPYADKIDSSNSLPYKTVSILDTKKNKTKQKKKAKTRLYIKKDVSGLIDDLGRDFDSANLIRSNKNTKDQEDIGYNSAQSVSCLKERSVVNEIRLSPLLTVQELADKISVPSTDIIKWLFLQGISVTINQLLDISISTLVAEHYSFNVLRKDSIDEVAASSITPSQEGRSRAPIITILGHVDHGKTALLQAIRKDDCLIREAGDITQSIGSYEVLISDDNDFSKLIFLDTPGHEAFASMRKRGASITDLAVLVVSADDGLKPQTLEAIEYIQRNNLPFLVAINKIDKPEADVLKVKDQLSTLSIEDESVDGNSTIIHVSALTGQNIDSLLSAIIALSKAQNLKSDPSVYAEGVILEAHLSKKKGPVAQLLVKNGTLHVGDILVAGRLYGKVKAITGMLNQKMNAVESVALADTLCFTEVPEAGLLFKVAPSEKAAKALISKHPRHDGFTALNARISLDDLGQKGPKKIIKQINLILKTASQGAIDAVMHTLIRLPQEKVQINLLFAASGEVSLKDIELAYASNSLISVFGLSVPSSIMHAAEKRGVHVAVFHVIYDLVDYIQNYMLEFIDLDYEKQILGYAKVKNLFAINKGIAAGCSVENGKLKKESHFQIKRFDQIIYAGIIDSLKILKDDVDEVSEGSECGVMCKEYSCWEIGDLLECYMLNPLEKTL